MTIVKLVMSRQIFDLCKLGCVSSTRRVYSAFQEPESLYLTTLLLEDKIIMGYFLY